MNAIQIIQLPSTIFGTKGEERRIHDLEQVLRFEQAEKVIHRNNLHTHMSRVSYFSHDLALHLKQTYNLPLDQSKTQRLAMYHDDPEVITGDIPTPIKYSMKPAERQKLRKAEEEAIKALATRYFGINPLNRKRRQYLQDQFDMTKKETLEARIVNIADKIEGLCETIHEIRCGNTTFHQILNNYRNFFANFIPEEQLFSYVNADEKYKTTLDVIPTVEQALEMQPISITTFKADEKVFWKEVFNPNLPSFYKQWLLVSTIRFTNQQLFPGWKEEIKNRRPTLDIITNFIA